MIFTAKYQGTGGSILGTKIIQTVLGSQDSCNTAFFLEDRRVEDLLAKPFHESQTGKHLMFLLGKPVVDVVGVL